METFQDKVVWITGASSGIGRELAVQLNALGAQLVLSARSHTALAELKATLQNQQSVLIVALDLEKPAQFAEALSQVLARFGKVDVLINNAGISQRSLVVNTAAEVDRRLMEVNYFGTIALTKTVLPQMLRQGHGHFVAVTSLVGKFGYGMRSAYSASKHALHGFFETLHIELHAQGIRVTLVCPGPVQTPISLNALDGNGKPTGIMDEMQQKGMPVSKAVKDILDAVLQEKNEVIIGSAKEKLGVKIKSWWPKQFFKMALKQNPQGEVKL